MMAQIIVPLIAVFSYWLMSPEGVLVRKGEIAKFDYDRPQYLHSVCSWELSHVHYFMGTDAFHLKCAVRNTPDAKPSSCNSGKPLRHVFVSHAVHVPWRKRPTWTNADVWIVDAHPLPASPDAGGGKGRPFRGLITDDCNGNVSLCLIQHSLGDSTTMRRLASVGVMSFLLTEVRSDKISVVPRPRGEIGCRPFETPVQVRFRCVAQIACSAQACWLIVTGNREKNLTGLYLRVLVCALQ